MKKYILLILLPAVTLQFSCNKNLDPEVVSSLTSVNAFVTESDAIAAVNAVYARLKGPSITDNYDYWTVRHFALTDLPTDVGNCSYGGDPGQLSMGQWNSANGLLAEDWRQIYKLIADANSAIYNITPMTSITAAEKAQFLAEVKFLRAVAYMDLTDAWGPVVLATEQNLANPNYLSQAPVSSVADIETLLISDLQNSINVLPVSYAGSTIYSTNDPGRATKGAAMTLLGKLYLRQHQWQKSADMMEQVITAGTYQLYPSYQGLFLEANKWCSENIFSVLSDANVNGTELMNHFGPLVHPAIPNRWQYYAVTWSFYHSFAANDARGGEFFPKYHGTDGLIHEEAPTPGATPPAGVYYMPNVATSKYADSTGSVNSYYDGHSVDILRYADVLLSRAEALNELNGPNPESIQLINEVRQRSNATPLVLGNYTQTSLRLAILQERGWEFFYEGKRRADLLRMGEYDIVENAYLKSIGLTNTISLPKDEYFSYPLNQAQLNPNLSNAGREQ